MRYGVIGAGAMGYRYGVLLQEKAGIPVDFIETWDPNREQVQKQGGVYVSRDHENRHLVPINIYAPEDYHGHPDVWIVFKKQMQLADELERDAAAGLFHPDQYVFSAMNGLGHFEKLAQYFNPDQMLAGTAMIATVLNGPGDVDFMGPENGEAMHMAPYNDQAPDETMEEIYADFQRATLGPEMCGNWLGMCLTKVAFNAVCNTLCTMFEINMGQFGSYPGAAEMAEQLFNEAHDAAARAGIKMIEDRGQQVQSVLDSCVKLKYHYPSMYQDFSKGRPTEVDYINGYIARLGRKNDYPCRTHEFVTHEVHLAEQMRQYRN
ncbi:2-dehydropantoate 2-reductase [Fructilactobacillus hinvesii]|uniref:2-dehydropantoate 2-reductase n=1 Tax=Fructilactobacillus hinvesii TaxID=2940300 RepID=A0ABY5BV30_9LACO|nr:2-dehydropantoate 2-reductase [Fructilactobacillus hinvesii]USS88292.1 2-dehydropantoate 2-reductase [Fructilactobacillus hinvesii]